MYSPRIALVHPRVQIPIIRYLKKSQVPLVYLKKEYLHQRDAKSTNQYLRFQEKLTSSARIVFPAVTSVQQLHFTREFGFRHIFILDKEFKIAQRELLNQARLREWTQDYTTVRDSELILWLNDWMQFNNQLSRLSV